MHDYKQERSVNDQEQTTASDVVTLEPQWLQRYMQK